MDIRASKFNLCSQGCTIGCARCVDVESGLLALNPDARRDVLALGDELEHSVDGARDGHNDVIMDSLNSGVDVDDVTTLGKWTALQFAARSAKLACVFACGDVADEVRRMNGKIIQKWET